MTLTIEKEFEARINRALHDIQSLRRPEGELDAIESELKKGLRIGLIDLGYIYEKTEVVKKSMDFIRSVTK